MAVRVYLMPRIGTGATIQDSRRPKYQSSFTGVTSAIHYGPEPYCIVISDVTTETHDAVMLNADVRAVPADLDSTITNAARLTISSSLEAASIPAQWVVNGMTYRTFVRRLRGIFSFMQNMSGRKLRFLQATLDDPISALPANVRQALAGVGATLQIDTSGITPATTLRTALGNVGLQFASRPIQFQGLSL